MCEECGYYYTEYHHVIFRSQGGFTAGWNEKRLCPSCHKGNSGPHRNKKSDLKYKFEVQQKLETMLTKDYYNADELQIILTFTPSQTKKLIKALKIHKEGYNRDDIIRRCMGGKIYERCEVA